MLTISGMKNFYYIPEFTDMRCKAERISQIIRRKFNRDPFNGDVYIFMSKNRKKLKLIHYENHAYYLHEKTFTKGYKYMRIDYTDNGSRGRDVLKDFLCDNSIAEQCIRPLTRERANSLHYASHKGAEVSAIYHTIFSTCKMLGISALDYLKKFFQEVLKGNTDYAALLPATIGLKK